MGACVWHCNYDISMCQVCVSSGSVCVLFGECESSGWGFFILAYQGDLMTLRHHYVVFWFYSLNIWINTDKVWWPWELKSLQYKGIVQDGFWHVSINWRANWEHWEDSLHTDIIQYLMFSLCECLYFELFIFLWMQHFSCDVFKDTKL